MKKTVDIKCGRCQTTNITYEKVIKEKYFLGKVAQRSSTRTQKKPDWLGNNIMVTKIEQEFSVGESLPSVYEIPPPQ